MNVMGCEAAMWIVSALRRERKRRGPGLEREWGIGNREWGNSLAKTEPDARGKKAKE